MCYQCVRNINSRFHPPSTRDLWKERPSSASTTRARLLRAVVGHSLSVCVNEFCITWFISLFGIVQGFYPFFPGLSVCLFSLFMKFSLLFSSRKNDFHQSGAVQKCVFYSAFSVLYIFTISFSISVLFSRRRISVSSIGRFSRASVEWLL